MDQVKTKIALFFAVFLLCGVAAAHAYDSPNAADEIIAQVKRLYPSPPASYPEPGETEVLPCLLCLEKSEISQIFAPPLAPLLIKASEHGRDVGGCLGYGPLAQGQDHAIKNFQIDQPVIEGDTATVTVHFINFIPATLRFDVVQTDAGWRISNFNKVAEEMAACLKTK